MLLMVVVAVFRSFIGRFGSARGARGGNQERGRDRGRREGNKRSSPKGSEGGGSKRQKIGMIQLYWKIKNWSLKSEKWKGGLKWLKSSGICSKERGREPSKRGNR